ncbi:MAG TPA: hypothetical protein VGJ82_13095 [Thermoanaerobaculia bacterium]|jgi:hypothetical protein
MDYRRTAVVTFLFLFATGAFADAVGDARNALQRMTATEPLHAVVQLDRSRHSHGRFLNDDFDGSVSFEVDEDAGGIRSDGLPVAAKPSAKERRACSSFTSTPSEPKRGPSRRAATPSSRCASKTVRPSTDPASTATRAAPGPFADASETNADAR